MGQVRSACRALLLDHPSPRAALAGLDRFAARLPGAHTRLAQQLQALGYRVTLEHAA